MSDLPGDYVDTKHDDGDTNLRVSVRVTVRVEGKSGGWRATVG